MRPINPIHLCIKSATNLTSNNIRDIYFVIKNVTLVAFGSFVPISKQAIIRIPYNITHKDSSINKNKAQDVVSWNLVFLKNSVKHFIFQL